MAAVLTAMAVVPFYALLRRLVSRQAALLTTLLFASARWLLLFSRSGWNNGNVVLLLLLAAWSLTLALERKQLRYWLGLGTAWALLAIRLLRRAAPSSWLSPPICCSRAWRTGEAGTGSTCARAGTERWLPP